MKPASVVDLACNTGWYSRLAASKGAKVVALDSDAACIDLLFRRAEAEGAEVVPVISDLLRALRSFELGWRGSLCAASRFRSECALALAISHHLVLSPLRLDFDAAAEILSTYTARYLLTEFVSFEDASRNPYSPLARPGCTGWYRMENFVAALGRRFHEVAVVPGPKGRLLILCEGPRRRPRAI